MTERQDLVVKYYTDKINKGSHDADLYNKRANLLAQTGGFSKALQDYTEAIRINPDNARYYRNRGN